MIITGKKFLEQLCKALDVDYSITQRVILDVSYDGIVKVYTEQVGTEKLYEINMSNLKIEGVIKDERN